MSLNVLTQGGGGGKTASIFVTGLDENSEVKAVQKVLNPELKNLPEGYTQVEYIESTGTQYIDTGFYATNNTKAVLDCDITYPSGWTGVFGSYSHNKHFAFLTHGTGFVPYWGTIGYDRSGVKGRTTFVADKNVWTHGGQTTTFPEATFTTGAPMYIFKCSLASDPNALMKLYSCQMYENDALVRDYIPCVNPSGEIGLYDVVTQTFYGNAGSGTFIAGAEVSVYVDGKTVQGKWVEKMPTLEPLIPEMTSNTTPSGTASATSYRSGYLSNAYMAFDGNDDSGADVWYGQAYALDTKIVYTFGEVQTNVKKVSLRGRIDANATLSSGAIEYTEDGSTWKTLVALNSSNFTNKAELTFEVSVDQMLGIRVGATASSNGRGLIVSALQVYGLVDQINGFKIEPIKEYGMYTVTATNGEKTVTQDVLVDAAVEYEIEMSYAVNYLMLYDYGDECEDVTGGLLATYSSASYVGTFTKNSDSIKIVSANTNKEYGCGTTNKIDLTDYSLMGMNVLASTAGNLNNNACVTRYGNNQRYLDANVGNLLVVHSTDGLGLLNHSFDVDGSYYIHALAYPNTGSVTFNAWFLAKADDISTLCTKAGLSAPTDLATLIADTTSITTILANESAVKYMVSSCTGDFMASFVGNSACLTALDSSPYKSIVLGNKHWAKFLAMVVVTA